MAPIGCIARESYSFRKVDDNNNSLFLLLLLSSQHGRYFT